MRPVIGITAYVEVARWGFWDTTATLLPYRYVEAVERAGGRAVVLPPYDGERDPVLDRLDGLLLAGGADISPARYGAAPHPQTSGVRPDRDAGELALLDAALAGELPLLGICRGMQLMTVALGGRLSQHLPDVVGHDRHRPAPGVYGDHPVRLAHGSRLGAVLGPDTVVRSYHHQGVDDPGPRLRVTGWADDGTVEAVELPGDRFAVGVLWHPEAGADPRLFDALAAAAGATAR